MTSFWYEDELFSDGKLCSAEELLAYELEMDYESEEFFDILYDVEYVDD